jgi:hypothetical protein
MAQTKSNGEWLEARKPTRAECEIVQDKHIRMVPTVTKDIKDSRQSMKPGGRKEPTGITNTTGNAVGWTKINVKRHVESDGPNAKNGMEHHSVNVGFIDVRFMCGNGKGFNVARGIKQFIAAARAIDKDFCLLPLGGQDNNLCIPADIPNSKEGIQKYFRHRLSVNNVAGSIKIQTKFSILRSKERKASCFRQHCF